MRHRRPRESRGLVAGALLALALTAAVATLSACGDGSNPAPPTRTLTPEATADGGKRGASVTPTVLPSASPTATPTTGTMTPAATATPAKITDKSIKGNILARIAREPGLRGFTIMVTVTDGVVYLRGRVRTKQQRSLAEQIALTEPGVKKVVSAIDVSGAAGY